MEFLDFVNIVEDKRKHSPILFGLNSDETTSSKEIEEIERYYCVQLPRSYKEFLKKYGGGYFAYTVIYSCDTNSNFNIIKNVSKEWITKYNFFPILDFETGDLGGFKLNNKKCNNFFSIFLHEEQKIIEDEKYDFFQALIKYGLKLQVK